MIDSCRIAFASARFSKKTWLKQQHSGATGMSILKHLFVVLIGLTLVTPVASAAPKGPGIEAIKQFRDGNPKMPIVQNRFFVKGNRFEIAPVFGYVPNNPFARRFVGAIGFGYHFNEQISAQGFLSYSPDLGVQDLKGLTKTLINISRSTNEGGNQFQQPLDKVTLAFSAVAIWSPVYGTINLIGEKVVNFDLYFVGGVALNVRTVYAAKYQADEAGNFGVALDKVENSPGPGPVLGTGMNFFINQTMALKLDARFNFYVGDKPVYEVGEPADGKRFYNNFVVAAGISFFLPKMTRRSYIY
jgi:outer membrane beta-barrel protein